MGLTILKRYPRADRNSGIGGTDIAAILDLDPRRDRFSVRLEKKGLIERQPPTWRMRHGQRFQRLILEGYEELTGKPLEHVDATFRHPTRGFQIFSPDALCKEERRGVEAKLVSVDQAGRWTENDIPDEYRLQVWWYEIALDFEVWDVVSLHGYDEPRVVTVEPPEDSIRRGMLEAAEEFWRRYIVGDEVPPMGWSSDAARYVHSRFPRNRLAMREATVDEVDLLEDYAQVREEEKRLKRDRDRLENTLKEAVADADGIFWKYGKFTWKNAKEAAVVDWEALADSLMRTRSEEERKVLLDEFSTPKKATRRIYFHYKEA